MATDKVSLTYREFMRLPETKQRHELLGGELIVAPTPSVEHQEIVWRLGSVLRRHADLNQLGKVFFLPVDVILGERDVVEPDITFIQSGRLGIIGSRVRGVPDLVVEVLSPSNRHLDRGRKMKIYAHYGVPEYAIVDPSARSVEIYQLDPTGYRLRTRVEGAERFTLSAMPGLNVGCY